MAVSLLALLALPSRAGKFESDEESSLLPGVKFSGLLDLRASAADKEVSWLRGGLGPLRYGGRDTDLDGRGDRRAFGAAVPQASVVLDAEVPAGARLHVQANFTTDASSGSAKVGVVEAYAEAQRAFGDDAFRLKAGGFIPHISWEHPDPAWSTRYTLTPSPIGSWVGEEIRVFGTELLWERPIAKDHQVRLTGGGFSGGDQIGRLLWFRGFAVHDFQGDLTAEYPLLGRKVRPLEEHDGHLGYYGRGDVRLFDRTVELGSGYWTNNGDDRTGLPAQLDSLVFRTKVFHYGGKFEWKRVTLLAQSLKATIHSTGRPAKDWSAAYGLASVKWGAARLSARYDRTWVRNWENAFGVTAFAGWDFGLRQQVALEHVYWSGRSLQIVRPRAQIDRLWQLNYRLRF